MVLKKQEKLLNIQKDKKIIVYLSTIKINNNL